VRTAGEVCLPIRPHNVNPFGNLYKLLSIGLHDRTDDECCEIVGAMDDSLKFILHASIVASIETLYADRLNEPRLS